MFGGGLSVSRTVTTFVSLPLTNVTLISLPTSDECNILSNSPVLVTSELSKRIIISFAFNPAPISMRPGFDRKKFETEHQKALKSPSWRIRKFWKDLISDPKLLSLREWAIEITKNTPPEIFVNSLYNFQMEDVRPLLERIDVPTLLLYGDLPISGLKAVKRLKEIFPSSETIIIRCGGQCFVNLVKANQYNKIVENFIEEEQ